MNANDKTKIINLLEIKNKPEIARVHRPRACEHSNFEVDTENATVSCGKCGKDIDPIEVLGTLAYSHSRYFSEIKYLQSQIAQLKAWDPVRKQTKKFNECLTGKRYPHCPICNNQFSCEELNFDRTSSGIMLDKIIAKRLANKNKPRNPVPATDITARIMGFTREISRICSQAAGSKISYAEANTQIEQAAYKAIDDLMGIKKP